MATIVETEDTNPAANPAEEVSNLDELQAEREPTEAEAVEASTEAEELPEKYQGKSAAELAEMHSNLERVMGKQSQEVGELRKAFDDMVKTSIASQNSVASAPEPEAEEFDFFADPQAAVARAIANHPTLKQAETVAVEMAKEKALNALQKSHPNMKEVLQDASFQEWVGKSKIRTQLYQNADQNYDYESANELLDLWGERREVVAKTAAVEKQAQKAEVKKAATGSARTNPTGQTTRKTYRRRDIIELMNRDPKRYEAMQDEIMRAYSEGRVK